MPHCMLVDGISDCFRLITFIAVWIPTAPYDWNHRTVGADGCTTGHQSALILHWTCQRLWTLSTTWFYCSVSWRPLASMIDNAALWWFWSYLSGRKQCVHHGPITTYLVCVVPQALVLGQSYLCSALLTSCHWSKATDCHWTTHKYTARVQ